MSSSTFTTRLKEVVSTLGRTKKPSLVRVLLGLPRARTAFGTIRSRFSAADLDSDGTISREELMAAPWVEGIDAAQLEVYFEQADIDHSSSIDLDEFTLLFCFLFFLEEAVSAVDAEADSIRSAFVAAASAFCCFDLNDDGVIERSEIKSALSGPRGGGGAFITPERMEELDWDKNGTVTFKEFLLAFVKWSGVGEDGDDDEADGAAAAK